MAMLLYRMLVVALVSAMMMDMKFLVVVTYLIVSVEMNICPETLENLENEQNQSMVMLVSGLVAVH